MSTTFPHILDSLDPAVPSSTRPAPDTPDTPDQDEAETSEKVTVGDAHISAEDLDAELAALSETAAASRHLQTQREPEHTGLLSHRRASGRAAERAARDEETADLVEQLRTCESAEEDGALRDRLVAVNMPLAAVLASRYRNRGESMDDLQQVAYVGLVNAATRFDPEAAHSFASFCVPTVLGEVRRHFRDRGWVVRPPRRVQEVQQKVLKAQDRLTHALGRPPSPAEIAEAVESPVRDVEEALAVRSCYSPTSLDRPVGVDGDAEDLTDLLPSEEFGEAAAEARVLLEPAVRKLSPRDQRIIALRFYHQLTQREIAKDIGVTQMQISRVLTRIFGELRTAIGAV